MNIIQEKLASNLKEAMKAGQSFEAGVFRMLISSFHNKEIEKKGKGEDVEISEEEAIDLLTKEAKKRKEAAEAYEKGNRAELAEKEKKELAIIEKFLPEQLSREEVEKIVSAALEKTGAKEIKEFGKVMGEAMKDLKGRADTSFVSEIIKEKLGS